MASPVLTRLWQGWKRIAFAIGVVQSKILLTVLYLVVVMPFALAVRLLADPLRTRRRQQGTYYLPTEQDAAGGLERATRQF